MRNRTLSPKGEEASLCATGPSLTLRKRPVYAQQDSLSPKGRGWAMRNRTLSLT